MNATIVMCEFVICFSNSSPSNLNRILFFSLLKKPKTHTNHMGMGVGYGCAAIQCLETQFLGAPVGLILGF
jgi:hypothetical protein